MARSEKNSTYNLTIYEQQNDGIDINWILLMLTLGYLVLLT